jgi:hypothetical protein
MLIALDLCVFLWISEKAVTFALYSINRLVLVTEVESVYCMVHTEFLNKTGKFCPLIR